MSVKISRDNQIACLLVPEMEFTKSDILLNFCFISFGSDLINNILGILKRVIIFGNSINMLEFKATFLKIIIKRGMCIWDSILKIKSTIFVQDRMCKLAKWC